MAGGRRIHTALVDARIVTGPAGGFRVRLRQLFAGRPLVRELRFDASPEQVAQSGGAAMHCPSCRAERRCDSVAPGRLGLDAAQRLALDARAGFQGLRRVRMCRSCFYHFVTAEVSESMILEVGEALDVDANDAEPGSSTRSNVIAFPGRGARRHPRKP